MTAAGQPERRDHRPVRHRQAHRLRQVRHVPARQQRPEPGAGRRHRRHIIKDSYANCFVPYLTANYADIGVVDFRNYNFGLDQLIADSDYDQILVLYSFDSFESDPLYRAGVTG